MVRLTAYRKTKYLSALMIAMVFLGFFPSCSGGNKEEEKKDNVEAIKEMTGIYLPETNPNNVTNTIKGDEALSDMISVIFNEGVSRQDIEKIVNNLEGVIAGEIPPIRTFYIKFSQPKTGDEINEIIKLLKSNNDVEAASSVYILKLQSNFPSTTDVENLELSHGKKWAFEKMKIIEAWQAIRQASVDLSDEIIVGVIDGCFYIDHPDLKVNFVLDIPNYPPHDFGDRDTDVSVKAGSKHVHGTHVAGIISSTINNDGINGVAPTVKIFPLKVIDNKWYLSAKKEKYPTSALTAAIVYATLAGCKVINMSLGGLLNETAEVYKDTALYHAIKYADERNVVLISSAGNNNSDASKHCPSFFEEIISVGATIENELLDAKACYSNFSDNKFALSVAACGGDGSPIDEGDIYSTVPTDYKYDYLCGTSQAAPFVSGVVSLMMQIDEGSGKDRTSSEYENILRQTADNVTVYYRDDPNPHTWKRINAFQAINKILEEIERDRSPTADISYPLNDSAFNEGDLINFTGSGNDPEGGALIEESLVWASDKDGQIGTGQSFFYSDLSVNNHIITLTVIDQQGAIGADTVEIIIITPPISIGQDAPTESIRNQFEACYERNGGHAILLDPTSEVYNWYENLAQDFSNSNSIILYNYSHDYAYLIQGAILEKYLSKVTELGAPISEEESGAISQPTGTTCKYQNFENGAIEVFESGEHQGQAFVILHPFFQKWADLGYANHDLGYPIEDQSEELTSYFGTRFKYQNFEGGALEHLIDSGKVVEIHGAIFTKWKNLNYAQSSLCLPTEDEQEATTSPISGYTGRYSVFEGGIIHWIRDEDRVSVIW